MANLNNISKYLFNTRTIVTNLVIVAIVYLLVTSLIMHYHHGSPPADTNYIPNKYIARHANQNMIYNFDKHCSKSQPEWKSFTVIGTHEFELYVSNALNQGCLSNTKDSHSSSLSVIVIIDPLHWTDLFIHSHSNAYNRTITEWNKYYTNAINDHKNETFIVVKYSEMVLNKQKMLSKLCQCVGIKANINIEPKYAKQSNDRCTVLNSILFLVFRSSIQSQGIDGRQSILKTWGKRYDSCDLNMKFVNTKSHKFANNSANELYFDVIQPPFEAESGMSLLWAIDAFGDSFEWVFKCDDVTYVIMENFLNYAIALNQYSHLQWWLGNRLQSVENNEKSIFTSGGAGYLMNKRVISALLSDIRSGNERNYRRLCGVHEWEDMCVSALMNKKYGITAAETIDNRSFEKFNVWCPMSLFGFGGIYALPIDWYAKYKRFIGQSAERVGVGSVSNVAITFHYIKPEWMNAYFELFRLERSAKEIEIISKSIGAHKEREARLKALDEYARVIRTNSRKYPEMVQNIDIELKSMGIATLDVNVTWLKDRYHTFDAHSLKLLNTFVRHDIVNLFGYQF